MDLIQTIKSAEKRYKQILEGYFVSVYDDDNLLSHGLGHHRRVWYTARELLQSLHSHGIEVTVNLTISLIIASYLHDIGMATEHGPKHGHLSAEICRKFLSEHSLKESDFPDLLDAIELHDDKDYSSSENINLRSLLSVADDLDAFGCTGIYRYLEIYCLRGIQPGEIAGSIRKNALSRYSHFEKLFSFDEVLVSWHRKRFEILNSFFMNYNNGNYTSPPQSSSPAGDGEEKGVRSCNEIVKIITTSISENRNIKSVIADNMLNPDNEISLFFKNLNSELSI